MAKLKGKALAAARRNIKKAQAARRKITRKTRSVASSVKRKIKRRRKNTASRSPVRPKKKSNSSKKKNNSMVFGKKIPLLGNPTVRKIFIASGAASIIGTAVAFIAPQFSAQVQTPIAKAIIGFLTGDIVGAAANFLIPTLAGAGATQGSSNGNGGNFA